MSRRKKAHRALSYARAGAADSPTVAAQRESNTARARADGLQNIEEITDRNPAASFVRSGLASVLSRAANGELSGTRIYVTEESHLVQGANPATAFVIVEIFKALGVEVVITSEEISASFASLADRAAIMRGAEWCRRHGQGIREGLARRRARMAAEPQACNVEVRVTKPTLDMEVNDGTR